MHEDLSREDKVKGGSDRSFGFVFAVVFLLIALWPLIGSWTAFEMIRLWALAISMVILLVALVVPRILAPANRLWIKFGLLLNRIVSPIVLGVMFFVVLTPVALFMRLRGKDLLNLRHDTEKETYWVSRTDDVPSSMNNQF